MKLVEISMISQADMSNASIVSKIRTMSPMPKNGKKFTEINGVEVNVVEGGRHHDFTFVKNGKTVGYAWLNKAKLGDLEGFYVNEIGFIPELQKTGLGLEFYKTLLSKKYRLFSGLTQTPAGRKVWEKLMKLPNIKIQVWDDNDGVEKMLSKDTDPWSDPFYTIIGEI